MNIECSFILRLNSVECVHGRLLQVVTFYCYVSGQNDEALEHLEALPGMLPGTASLQCSFVSRLNGAEYVRGRLLQFVALQCYISGQNNEALEHLEALLCQLTEDAHTQC